MAAKYYWSVKPKTFAISPGRAGVEKLKEANRAIREVRKMEKSETHFSKKRIFK